MDIKNIKIKELSDRIDGVIENLIHSVDEIASSQNFKVWLKMAATFHRYSLHNTLLIQSQMPGATRVAGFRKWKSLGRSVKRGERGIAILCPIIKKVKVKDVNGNESMDEEFSGFFISHVFDISQTEGAKIPVNPYKRVEGDDCGALYESLKNVAMRMGITISEETLPIGIDGMTDGKNIKISINNSMNHKALVMLHEISHILLHFTEGDQQKRNTREIEAEATSFAAASFFNLECQYSCASYLASWGADRNGLKLSMKRIKDASTWIIDAVENPEQIKPLREGKESIKTAA